MKILKDVFIFVIFTIFIGCNNDKIVKEYYNSGKLKAKYNISYKNLIEGDYELFYENGIIQEKRLYYRGNIVDTIKYFSKDGKFKGGSFVMKDSTYTFSLEDGKKVKEGMFLKNIDASSNNHNGWIKFYKNNLLKKKIYYKSINNKESHINEYLEYDIDGNIIDTKSCYFDLEMKDTLILNKSYLGKILFNSDAMRTVGFFTIVSDKIKTNFENINQIKLDTFYNNNNPDFVYTPKELGSKFLRGKFSEQFMVINANSNDSLKLDISVKLRDFYFEKKVYIKEN